MFDAAAGQLTGLTAKAARALEAAVEGDPSSVSVRAR
jgi:hypothetical protein